MRIEKMVQRQSCSYRLIGIWCVFDVDRSSAGQVIHSAQQRITRQCIGRVRVEVRSKLVRRHAPIKRIGDGQHYIGRRNFLLGPIYPSPDGDLTDLGAWDAFADTARQLGLSAGKFDGFCKGFF